MIIGRMRGTRKSLSGEAKRRVVNAARASARPLYAALRDYIRGYGPIETGALRGGVRGGVGEKNLRFYVYITGVKRRRSQVASSRAVIPRLPGPGNPKGIRGKLRQVYRKAYFQIIRETLTKIAKRRDRLVYDYFIIALRKSGMEPYIKSIWDAWFQRKFSYAVERALVGKRVDIGVVNFVRRNFAKRSTDKRGKRFWRIVGWARARARERALKGKTNR